MERGGTNTGYRWESQKERDQSEDEDVGWIILRLILERYNGVVWIGVIWLKIGHSVGLL
jgi:hypothetical protein